MEMALSVLTEVTRVELSQSDSHLRFIADTAPNILLSSRRKQNLTHIFAARGLQNRENISATGKLMGQVAPTSTELNSLIRLLSRARNQVITAEINDIKA